MSLPGAEQKKQLVLIVAGEASGDLHGARLLRSMLALDPGLHCCAMGGPELAASGAEMLYDAAKLAVVGISEVLAHLGDILRAQRILADCLRQRRPDLLILIDYPDFNLRVAAKAKKLGIPVFYYISPQVWAWRSRRVHTIMRLVTRLAVILPFEEAFYEKFGYQAEFVGHPLSDTVRADKNKSVFLREQGIALLANTKIIGLLPGSRSKEVAMLLPTFLQAAEQLSRHSPQQYVFLIPLAPTLSLAQLEEWGLREAQKKLNIHVIREERYNLMAACDAVMAASGTVLLELCLLDVPTVAAYRVSSFSYRMGRLLVRHLRYFSLVNLIADHPVLPELLQDEVSPERLVAEIQQLLEDETACQKMLAGFAVVRERLGPSGASDRAAAIALEILANSASETALSIDETSAVHLPVDGTLDLHTFQPSDVKNLVPDYLQACREQNIFYARIIHGKGTGTLRRTVHACLDRLDYVLDYRLADESAGSWGATLVHLRAKQTPEQDHAPPPDAEPAA